MMLNDMACGASARISGFDSCPSRADMITALRLTGFAEGDEVEILAHGPFGVSPLSVRLGRRIIGLRDNEAACIRIESGQAGD